METKEIQKQESGLGIAGMIIGIVSLPFSCIPLGGILGVVGLVLSIFGVTQKEKKTGTAVAGIVLNALALVAMIFMLFAIDSIKNDEDNSKDNTQNVESNNSSKEIASNANTEKENNSKESEEDTSTSAKSPANSDSDDTLADDIIDVDISDCHVKYIKHEIIENMSGEKCIAVYFEFTNNSDEGKSFLYTISDKAFQNGIELSSSFYHVNDESKNRSAEIKPGVTLEVCSGFVLRDEDADVEIEVGEWISFKKNPDDTMILSIK